MLPILPIQNLKQSSLSKARKNIYIYLYTDRYFLRNLENTIAILNSCPLNDPQPPGLSHTVSEPILTQT